MAISAGFLTGLVESLKPAQEASLKIWTDHIQNQNKANAQMALMEKLGIPKMIQDSQSPQRLASGMGLQGMSDEMEKQVGGQMVQPGAAPFNLNKFNDQQYSQNEGEQKVKNLGFVMSQLGLKSTDPGGMEFGGSRGGLGGLGNMVPLLSWDPIKETYTDASGKPFTNAQVPASTKIRDVAPTTQELKDRSAARGAGYNEGKVKTVGLDATQTNAITSNRAVVRSVDNLLKLYDKDPTSFERSSTPGARALMIGDEGVKEIELWRNNLLNYKAFSEGGKQLTNTELARTISVMTSFIRGEPVSRKAIQEMKQRAQENLSLLEGSYSKSKLGGGEDFSSMSDDELRKIAGQ